MKNHFQKKIFILLGISAILSTFSACTFSGDEKDEPESEIDLSNYNISISYDDSSSYKQVEYPMVNAEEIRIDSLYVQVGYELNKNRWILIGNSIEEDPTGLKLLLVDPTLDYKLIYRSKGAYESMILHPSFFKSSDQKDPLIILCALGQLESWGQELFFMKGDTINEVAYLDVAIYRNDPDDESGYRLEDISGLTQIIKNQTGIIFQFKADSITYFGVRNEIVDPILSPNELRYRYFNGKLIEEWRN
jgi:hypothetical protein